MSASQSNDRCPLCPEEPMFWSGAVDHWVQCDACDAWYHAACLALTTAECELIEKFHCPDCVSKHGPSTYKQRRRSSREHKRLNYANLNSTGETGLNWSRLVESRRFSKDPFLRMQGQDFTIEWARASGMREPIIFENSEGLDMKMPASTLTVREIAKIIGDVPVEIMDVATQSGVTGWTLYRWAAYFHSPIRDRILNVISLEVSDTKLAEQILRPRVVRELDWVDTVWPKHLKPKEYPKVQLYCLMSVKDSFTDFHIDFGGTSVFYHILSGEKIFYFIPPTPKNLKKYEKWSSSPDQSSTFLADEVEECYAVNLKAGNTMIIPTGWIHAVRTPQDSVVIGGNFLHGLNIGSQLAVYGIEERTHVPTKFRYPFYERICWYAGQKYASDLAEMPDALCIWEIEGLVALARFMAERVSTLVSGGVEGRKKARANIPPDLEDPAQLTSDLILQLKSMLPNFPDIDASSLPDPLPSGNALKSKLKLKLFKEEERDGRGETKDGGEEMNEADDLERPPPKQLKKTKSKLVVKLKTNEDALDDEDVLGLEAAALDSDDEDYQPEGEGGRWDKLARKRRRKSTPNSSLSDDSDFAEEGRKSSKTTSTRAKVPKPKGAKKAEWEDLFGSDEEEEEVEDKKNSGRAKDRSASKKQPPKVSVHQRLSQLMSKMGKRKK
ncbi:uncharacterized protein VTP21DRAFT_3908 [Calcarisporiella thermophila]|uniref:uncharacterized protein n=1 Tax=Calcarisporiella thermophila TaxID=911321 RepID=UPI00374263D9